VATGAKLIGDAYDSFRKLLDLLDFPLVLVEFAKVQNYVASGSVEHLADIAKVYEKCKPDVFFSLELFPGLKYRLKSCRVSVIIFASGKYVITGSKYLGYFHRSDPIAKAFLSSCAL